MHWFKSNHKAITLKFNEETGSATCVVLLLLPPVHDLTLMSRPSDSSQWHVLEVEQGPQDGRSFRFFPWFVHGFSIGNIWMFPKIVGFPPQSSILIWIFHYFHHPFWGTPNFWKHPYIAAGSDELCKVGVANSSRKQLGRWSIFSKKDSAWSFQGFWFEGYIWVISLYHFSMTFTSFSKLTLTYCCKQ